jgi:type VI secretion system protein ImpL
MTLPLTIDWTIPQTALPPIIALVPFLFALLIAGEQEPGPASKRGPSPQPTAPSFHQLSYGSEASFSASSSPAPLVLLLGYANSGKTALVNGLRAFSPASGMSYALEETVACWRFYEGRIMEVSGDLLASAAGNDAKKNADAEKTEWRRFISYLQKRRPARPLDGVVLTVSCSDLVGDSALNTSSLQNRATQVSVGLKQLCDQLAVTLPLYVVVTKCESLAGFDTFSSLQMRSRLHEMLGWSTPYNLEATFSPQWTAQAFMEVGRILDRLRAEFFAQDGAQLSADSVGARKSPEDELFLLPARLQELQPPLASYLERLLQGSGRQQFRGIYFSGSAASAGVQEEFDSPRASDSAFVADLFLHKIFPERALARPLDAAAEHRNRTAFALRTLCLLSALLLFPGVFWNWHMLRKNTPGLGKVIQALQNGQIDRAATPESAFEATYAAQALAAPHCASIFLPASLLPVPMVGSLDPDVQRSMPLVMNHIVYPGLHTALEHRIVAFLQGSVPVPAGAALSSPISQPPTPTTIQPLENLTVELVLLEDNIVLFNQLVGRQGAGRDLLNLAAFLDPDRFKGVSNKNTPGLDRIVRTAEDPSPGFRSTPIRGQPWKQPTVAKLESTVNDVLRQRKDSIAQQMSDLQAQIDQLQAGKMENYDQLQTLNQSLAAVQAKLKTPELQWLASRGDQLQVPSDITQQLERIFSRAPKNNPLLCDSNSCAGLPQLRSSIEQIAHDQALEFRNQQLADCTGIACALLTATDTKQQSSLQTVLANFLKLPFVAYAGAARLQEPESGRQMFWNPNMLQQAIQNKQDYDNFFAGDLTNISGKVRDTFEKVALARLEANMIDAVASAENFQPPLGTSANKNPWPEQAVFAEARSFQVAAPKLNDILTQYGDLDWGSAAAERNGNNEDDEEESPQDTQDVEEVVSNHAFQLLTRLDEAFKQRKLYWPPNDLKACKPGAKCAIDFARWNAGSLPSLDDYGLSNAETMASYLAAERQTLQLYVDLAQPLVAFLKQHDSGDPRQTGLLSRWQGLVGDLQTYASTPASSGLGSLEDFLTNHLDKVATPDCQIPSSPVSSLQLPLVRLRNSLQNSLRARCQVLSNQAARQKYSQMVEFFNCYLAGKFPFAAPPPDDSLPFAEADPSDVLKLFQMLDADGKSIRLGMQVPSPDITPAAVAKITAFLDQIDGLRPIFAALLSGQPGAVPALDFAPSFRVNRAHESASGDHIIDWTLQAGTATFRKSDPPSTGHWTFADPVHVILRWAKDSPEQPLTRQPAGDSNSGTVSFDYQDSWSLFLLLMKHAPPAADLPRSVDSDPITLVFTVNEGVATAVGKTAPPAKSPDAESARVFMRLKVSAPGKTDSLRLPPFPSLAPLP